MNYMYLFTIALRLFHWIFSFELLVHIIYIFVVDLWSEEELYVCTVHLKHKCLSILSCPLQKSFTVYLTITLCLIMYTNHLFSSRLKYNCRTYWYQNTLNISIFEKMFIRSINYCHYLFFYTYYRKKLWKASTPS